MDDRGDEVRDEQDDELCLHGRRLLDCPICLSRQSPRLFIWNNV